MPTWQGVSEFVSVAELGSFTRAARALDLSVAQVSREVTRLEQRLHVQLLYRTTRQLTLTESGQLYLQHCRQLLDGLDEAERALSLHQAVPQGRLKLTAPVAYGESHIAPLITDFLQQYPALDIQLNLTNQVLDLVAEGYDLAIRLGHLSESSLVARRLASRRQHVCRPGLFAASRPAQQPVRAGAATTACWAATTSGICRKAANAACCG
jgi:DNA-binding transcriptional LysR family regulator